MKKTVVIDCFPDSVERYVNGFAVVSVDVIRATTTAVTAVAMGRRCFPVPTLGAAIERVALLDKPLLAGELGGNKPFGFHLNNSPVEISRDQQTHRPIILLSTSGTQLIYSMRSCDAGFVACFRNSVATADYLARRYSHVAVIGAGTRGEFREEDQMCCAWIAERLLQQGFAPGSYRTLELVERWKGASPQACYVSKSVGYLKKTNQMKDLKFILSHINDLNSAFMLLHDEIIEIPVAVMERGEERVATEPVGSANEYWRVSH